MEISLAQFPIFLGCRMVWLHPNIPLAFPLHKSRAPVVKEQARQEGIALYISEFGTRYVACGNMGKSEAKKKAVNIESKVLS